MTRPRVRAAAIAVLVVVECLFLIYLVLFGWAFRSLMLEHGDPEIAIRTRTVGVNAVWLALNLFAAVAYVFRRGWFGRYAILVVLGVDVGNAAFAALVGLINRDPGTATEWVVEALIPAGALVLIWRTPAGAPLPTGG